jgi:hypothetical protein
MPAAKQMLLLKLAAEDTGPGCAQVSILKDVIDTIHIRI